MTELPEICVDAAGFDRIAFHKQFNADKRSRSFGLT
jgi:hypothetical protein